MTPADVITLVTLFFTLVVVIPLIVAAWSDAHKRQLAFRHRELEYTAERTAEKAAQYAAHVGRLEQRVRALECIAGGTEAERAGRIHDLRTPVSPQGELQ